MNYEVWLHARDPKTLELVATLRVFTHPEREAAETALENAEALFTGDGRPPWGIPSGSLVTTHMRRQLASLVEVPSGSDASPIAHMFGDKR